ncbi:MULTISPECIES: hypothetical protein [Aeromonas]|uniref:hypothetical protein n=1 Tax=Aeromonas TaxID=642 RepID=UPI002B0572C9|nr:hypothetical protein [Aeromonas jandaei]
MARHLMNTATGSVDTEESWEAEILAWGYSQPAREELFSSLVEVVKDEAGNWVKAE